MTDPKNKTRATDETLARLLRRVEMMHADTEATGDPYDARMLEAEVLALRAALHDLGEYRKRWGALAPLWEQT